MNINASCNTENSVVTFSLLCEELYVPILIPAPCKNEGSLIKLKNESSDINKYLDDSLTTCQRRYILCDETVMFAIDI